MINLKANLDWAHKTWILTAAAAVVIVLSLVSVLINLQVREALLLVVMTVFSWGVYAALGGRRDGGRAGSAVLVLLAYATLSGLLFSKTATNVFRSDYWLIATLFNDVGGITLESVKKIAFFEMFGDLRFQPLAHLLMYARHLVFGSQVLLYHITNILLHTIVGFSIFYVLLTLTKDRRFSYLFGLLFVVLTTHFDTVVWTYHVYIVVSTLTICASLLLIHGYVSTMKLSFLVATVLLMVLASLLYEPIIFMPVFVPFLVLGISRHREKKIESGSMVRIFCVVFAGYLVYLFLLKYTMPVKEPGGGGMTFGDLLSAHNLYRGVDGLFTVIWKNSFLKNLGLLPEVKTQPIVYLHLPKTIMNDFLIPLKVAAGLALIYLFSLTRKNVWLVFSFMTMAAAYLFLILLGRLLHGNLGYVATQPRYYYFPNAFILIGVALALWPKYRKGINSRLTILLLGAILFWNTQNTLYANRVVADAISDLDRHYYSLKEFFSRNTSAKLFMDFAPFGAEGFFLGSDISMDVLFDEGITKHVTRATHIYDGQSIRKNPGYIDGGPVDELEGFTIQWLYRDNPTRPPRDNVVIIGGAAASPKVSITPDRQVMVELTRSSDGMREAHRLRFAVKGVEPEGPSEGTFRNMPSLVLEKDGEWLCLIYNGRLKDKVRLDSTYSDRTSEGMSLLGDYYRGTAAEVYVAKMFVQFDEAKYGCGALSKGSRVDVAL